MATAAISAGASILSGILGGKGAKKAAQAQAAAIQAGVDEQRRQFDTTQTNMAPYLQAGTGALNGQGGLLDLLGMNGNDAQGAAIAALKASPQFTSQYDTGLDAINQSAAATGGLRGGNTALAQSNFGAGLLNTVLGQQIGNVGGLVQLGSGTANSLGQLGQNNANSISQLLSNKGGAQAAGILGQTNATTGMIRDLGSIFGSSGGVGGNLFGGGASFGSNPLGANFNSSDPYGIISAMQRRF
ncbi:hypothetical protein FPZ24_08135 [Sphingomonas panacisoli]|uniref:DNA transfer protein n=1 Tax=Sphingomonas panacisoli TaxID=1813879 RepID=A0A5B8LIM2_9SPHN|nr:hypothetical protein [Sphingomonas panacisoli]QDZ07452.1 hypothetical protein FPZ24_08135 [Sphingomonas panacisoli]